MSGPALASNAAGADAGTGGARGAVLLIGNYPPPPGGVPSHLAYLAPALVDAGYDVHVLSGGATGVEAQGRIVVHKYPRSARRWSLLRSPIRNIALWRRYFASLSTQAPQQAYAYMSTIALGRAIVERHQIVAISAYNVMSYAPVGAVLSAEYGIPLVISSFGELFKHRTFFDAQAGLVDFTLKQATRLVSMTEHCAAVYRERAAGAPYDIVPYGIDLDRFHPGRTGRQIREGLGIPESAPLVLYLARLTREMGLAVFADAVRLIRAHRPDLKFLIGGKPDELYGLAQALGDEHRGAVFVRGNVAPDDLPEWYAAATIVSVPSLDARACGSMSAAEASATGRPVVASRVGGVPEFVVDGETGRLVPPGNPTALADAILELSHQPDTLVAMGSAGRQFAETRLDVRQTNARMCEIIGQVAKPMRGGSPS